MELDVLNRLLLLNLLMASPAEADISMHRIVRDLRNALSFSEQEHEEIALTRTDNGYTWKPDAAAKFVKIGPKATALIVGLLTKANDDKTLKAEYLPLVDKFLPDFGADDDE
jgi:hypothetical protein